MISFKDNTNSNIIETKQTAFEEQEFIKEQTSCFDCFVDKTLTENRTIYFKANYDYPYNKIDNTKYNFFTFVPKCLFEQFQLFSNLFFLLITVSQLFDVCRVGYMITYVGPLVLVVIIAMAKEGIEDIQRYLRDREVNNSSVEYWDFKTKSYQTKYCKDVCVGDILQIKDRVPADCVIMNTFNENGDLFIKTDQLDGETDWKQRICVKPVFDLLKNQTGREWFHTQQNLDKFYLESEAPNKNIYKYSAKLHYVDVKGKLNSVGVDVDNCIWANTKVTSGHVEALVIYTGPHTKMQMNQTKARFKFGRIDVEVNYLMKVTISMMVLLAFGMVVISGLNKNSPIIFIRYVLLFSYIIPISTKVNLDIAKIFYCNNMSSDKLIQGCVPRNFSVPEELSRINYVFSDKTGTLTKNEMTLKKLFMYQGDEIDIEEEADSDFQNIKRISASIKYPFIVDDEEELNEINKKNVELKHGLDKGLKSNHLNSKKTLRKDILLKNAVVMLGVCNNVNPTEDENERKLQASSPDEIAFVEFTDKAGYYMFDRKLNEIVIKDQCNNDMIVKWEILTTVPFRSETKKMRIVVRNMQTNQLVLMVKGAESECAKLVNENEAQWLIYKSKEISKRGLRTLTFCYKYISEETYREFREKYDQAYPEEKEQYVKKLELNCRLSCLTGVEDKLQDLVCDTISSLKQAGIKIWMLTGDKIETAKCIAASTDLKSVTQDFAIFSSNYYIQNGKVKNTFIDDLVKHEMHIHNNVLVLDGDMLEYVLRTAECKYIFLRMAMKAPSVMICRCSPTQKAEIVKIMSMENNINSLAIGDGGNDVAMIQESHVGIGIFGKEGKQAALSSDFSITQFSHLKNLLFWHGRLGYKRTSALAQFIIHRGVLITIVQLCFSLSFYNSPVSMYNGYLMIGYSCVFTTLPIMAVILDEDVDISYALNYPDLYKVLSKSRALSTKTFMVWIWQSAYQGSIIILLSIMLFADNYLYMVSISFTCLILCEFLNVRTTVTKWHWLMSLCIVLSLAMYAGVIYVLDTTFDIGFIINQEFWIKIAIITGFAWVPVWLVKYVSKCMFPSDTQKLQSANQYRELNEQMNKFKFDNHNKEFYDDEYKELKDDEMDNKEDRSVKYKDKDKENSDLISIKDKINKETKENGQSNSSK